MPIESSRNTEIASPKPLLFERKDGKTHSNSWLFLTLTNERPLQPTPLSGYIKRFAAEPEWSGSFLPLIPISGWSPGISLSIRKDWMRSKKDISSEAITEQRAKLPKVASRNKKEKIKRKKEAVERWTILRVDHRSTARQLMHSYSLK